MNYTTFTSESVSNGHPDKICDQICDAILDEALSIYPKSRVAIETMVTKNRVVIAGEVTCPEKLDYQAIARSIIKNLGYTVKQYGFWHRSPISVYVHEQSPDIAVGVNGGGAGDQGIMYGYACDETPELMPMPIVLAHRLVETIDRLKKTNLFLRPDGKTEIKVRYEKGRPTHVEKVVIAVPHDPKITNTELTDFLFTHAIKPVLASYQMEPPSKTNDIIVNGTGKWEIGGPASDTGVTGRKIMVDTYGGMSRHGGGAFSGKDPTKVDRSAAYAARFLAKNIVAKNYATRVEVQLSYVIGKRAPLSVEIETFGTAMVDAQKINRFANNLLDLSVKGIIDSLHLNQPFYRKTASYGHFGRDNFPWEKIIG